MNLHQCKGLEAPFVFLVDPSGETEHDVSVHIDRSGKRARGYLPIYGRRRSQWGRPPLLAHPPNWDQLAATEQRFLEAETNRLLYVAATRAGVQLVISQRDDPTKNEQNPWRLFGDYLSGAEAFAEPGDVSVTHPAEVEFDADKWQDEVRAIESRWDGVVQPTYATQAIKEAAIRGGAKPHGAEKGGAQWGTVLHTLLETALKRPAADLHDLAVSALESEELPVSLADEAVMTVRRVIQSHVWVRAQNANRCLTEVPMGVLVPASDAPSGLPTVARGVLDLVFLEAAGWVIVDYKTERVGAAELPKLVDYYRPQIDAYADVWQKAVGQVVVERGLLFTHTGEYRPV
jgi:ATP-dependent helicase/nuclease subunit A